jgi:phosphohistidine phosphatase SixA
MTANETKIYLVRHAEKLDMSMDPPLSKEGEARANALAKRLGNKKIDKIYATLYVRTRLTAKPLSEATGVPISEYASGRKFCRELKKMDGETVVVFGHSNRIPEIIEYLCGEKVSISEDDYDNLFEITLRDGKAVFVAKKYGK